MRLLSTLIVASLMLTACGAGEATPSALEPTRTPSSASTPAPRPTKGPPDTPAPKPTARALAKNAITLDNAADLKVQATRDEAAVTQIYAVKGNRVLGVSSRSFEMLDADTLETKTKMPYALKRLAKEPVFWYTGSPDAATGATMEADGTVTIYNLESGQVGKTLKVPTPKQAPQTDIALNEGGSELIFASGSVQRYSVETGEPIGKAQDLPADTQRIIFAEDGSKVAAAQANGEIMILDTRTRKPKAPISLKPGFKDIDQFYFSPDGTWFGAANGTAAVLIWNLDARKPEEPAQTIVVDGAAFPVFDAQGKRMAILNKSATTVYNLSSGASEQELRLSGGVAPLSAHFSADGATIFIASDSAIESFNLSDGKRLQSSLRLAMSRLAFTKDGKRILTWGTITQSPELGVVDAASGDVVARLRHDSPVRFVMQGEVGKFVVVVTRNNTTHVWSLDDASEVLTLAAPATAQRSGALCLTPNEDGVVMIVDDEVVIEPTANSIKKSKFKLPAGVTNFASCSNSAGYLTTITDKGVQIFDLTGATHAKFDLPADAELKNAALFQMSDDGKILAAVTKTALYIWDVSGESLSHKVDLEAAPLFGFTFDANNQRIDVNYGDAVDLVDVASGKRVTLNIPNKPTARWINILPAADGDTVVTVAMVSDTATAKDSVDKRNYRTGELTVWSAKTGDAVQTIETSDPLYTAAINEAGTAIATGGRSNVLSVWGVK